MKKLMGRSILSNGLLLSLLLSALPLAGAQQEAGANTKGWPVKVLVAGSPRTLEISQSTIALKQEKGPDRGIPISKITEVTYDNSSHSKSRGWLHAAQGIAATPLAIGVYPVAAPLAGAAIAAPFKTRAHFVRILWNDAEYGPTEVLLEIGKKDYAGVLAELQSLTGKPWRNLPEERKQRRYPSPALDTTNLPLEHGQTQTSQTTPSAPLFHEELIGELPHDSQLQDWFWVHHGRHLMWVEKQGGSRIVRIDSKQQGGVYKEVEFLAGSADEAHFAFFAKRDSKWILVMDGHEGSQEYSFVTSLAFQPNGSSFAYGACVAKKNCRLIVDGADTGPQYEDISYPKYSTDGKRLAYFGKRGNKWIAVLDGKEVELEAVLFRKPMALSDFSDFGFSRDGSRFFVAGRVDGVVLWTYFVDGVPGPWFQVISNIVFSSDGRHYAYGGTMAQEAGLKTFKRRKVSGTMVLDGQATATYEGSGLPGSWVGLVDLGREMELIRGVRTFDVDFYGISTPDFSPAGTLVYAARRQKGDIAMFVGSDAGPGFEEILSPVVFSGDSQHFAYVAKRGDDLVEVRDNIPGLANPTGGRGPIAVEWIEFSRDAAHLAYQTLAAGKSPGRGRPSSLRSVVIDGHESKIYNGAGNAHFLDDGKSLTFFALDGSKLLRVSFSLE